MLVPLIIVATVGGILYARSQQRRGRALSGETYTVYASEVDRSESWEKMGLEMRGPCR